VTIALRDQCVAFAGVCQAADLVNRTAHGLPTEFGDVEPLIASIFATDPDTVDDVYGSIDQLRSGIAVAHKLLTRPGPDMVATLKYVMALIDIERRLRRNSELTGLLRDGIDRIRPAVDAHDGSVIAAVSALYQRTISTLDRRIHVTGLPELLQQPDVAARIRMLLLAGIRGAWLWHQSGGRRWHLLARRSTIRHTLNTLAKPTVIH
jgi:high frequency lysogenization protein